MTIVMVLHDLNMAARYSDYLYVIKDGGLYAGGAPGKVITQEPCGRCFASRPISPMTRRTIAPILSLCAF